MSRSDGEGVARFSYTGRAAGTDTVVAKFTDENGFENSSEPITVVWQAPPPPPSPPVQVPSQQLPPPVLGKTVNAVPKKGSVKVKLPGTNEFVDLAARVFASLRDA